MPRLWFVLFAVLIALIIFTVIDVVLADRRRIRGVSKPIWVVIAFLPVLGTLLWFTVGRGPLPAAAKRVIAPDDDPAFFTNLANTEEQNERIRRLEQELAELDDEPDEK